MKALAPAALGLGVVALAALLLSGPATRLGLLPWQAGLALFGIAGLAGLLAAAVAAGGFCLGRLRRERRRTLLAAVALGLAAAAWPAAFLAQARSVPPIHDISTDFSNPEVAGQQRLGYPDLAPLDLKDAPDAAYSRALAAAEAMGWEIVARDAPGRRFEAVATSAWFGFQDDVLVRVTAAGPGSRVDMRSRSRVGRSDLGANARRIRAFFERLK